MKENDDIRTPKVLDTAQLKLIESVHGGFLYQHLYAVGCLLLAQANEVETVMVELDEDIELITKHERIFIQVKTRSKPIIPSDISSALERFKQLQKRHIEAKGKGKISCVIVSNQEASTKLKHNIDEKLCSDVVFVYPNSNFGQHSGLPPAWASLNEGIAWCTSQAEQLNFSVLSPSSLVWKLAGLVQLASTGGEPYKQHEFHVKDLPALFEQLIVQLQDFPAPPPLYRPQKREPLFISDKKIRIICGLSGAGKTSWAAQAALHSLQACAYYDTGDLPGPALAISLVRELTAKFLEADDNNFRKVLLTGTSGYEALRAFDTYLCEHGHNVLLVLDNAHRVPVDNLRDVLNATTCIRFILLCQPHENIRGLEAIMGVQRELLLGWDTDTVAAAVDDYGGFATAQGFERLLNYTGGLPLYVHSAAKVAVSEYGGNVDVLCAELMRQENSVETAQEIILTQVYEGFDKLIQDSLAIFSLADIGLSSDEVSALLVESLHISKSNAAIIIKKMRATGTIEVFGKQTLKVHDAVRAVGLLHLESLEPETKNNALLTLKSLLIESLEITRDTSRFALLTQVFIKLNDVMALISLLAEELFHEMGINIDIQSSLECALVSGTLEPLQEFWLLDAIVFSEIKEGRLEKLADRFEAIENLLSQNEFSYREQVAYAMKRILYSAGDGDSKKVEELVANISVKIPDDEHQRIFDYNHALALRSLKQYKKADLLCQKVIEGYFDLFGVSANDVSGRNSDALWEIINRPENVHEHLKHLADALELFAQNSEACGRPALLARVHSMKFYNMVGAGDSLVRVGQDLADQFVGANDFEGAKKVMEEYVLPVVNKAGLIGKLVQVRSQYAVILSYCGKHREASFEMRRLRPYFDGLTGDQRQEIENQSNIIAQLARRTSKSRIDQLFGKVGRNELCPCGSGRKYKKCCGA